MNTDSKSAVNDRQSTVDSLKLLLVQHDVVLGDVDANLNKIDNLLNLFTQKADIIILTEMFSTGFSMKPERLAETANGKAVKWLIEKAQAFKSAIVASVMTEDDGKYYNRAFFVYPDGHYVYYDKRHLFGYGGEDTKFTAGKSLLTVEYSGWKICPLVCYDLRFPVWSRNVCRYDLLIYVASWPDARQNVWSVLPVARAMENQCYVATANRVGNDKTGNYSGESKVVNQFGETLAQSIPDAECLTFCEISLSKLHAERADFPFLDDADAFCLKLNQ
ncbi:MAG: nitrilase family protein [Prevotellaceae bacterium]|jgi:predicted amidohydrolase|nr:nitrilase family protein [Prevotellaceae bacterium]